MIDVTEKSFLKYILFFNLYASEGLIFALSTVITVLYFNELNIPISTTTFVAGIVNVPWILKFLPGPIIDHFIKLGKKPFIIFGGLTGALCLFPLALFDPTYTAYYSTLIILTIGITGILILRGIFGNLFLKKSIAAIVAVLHAITINLQSFFNKN